MVMWWTLVHKQKSYSTHIAHLKCLYTVSWRKSIRQVVLGYSFRSHLPVAIAARGILDDLNWLSTRICDAGRPHVGLCHILLVFLCFYAFVSPSRDVSFLFFLGASVLACDTEYKSPPGGHIEFCQKAYFMLKVLCWIAKCGEDIINHSRDIENGRFSIPWTLTLTLTLTCQKLKVTFGTDAEHPCQISWQLDFYFWEFTSVTALTNLPTNQHDWSQYVLMEVTL